MKEGFPSQYNERENISLLHDAEYVINALWEKVMDVSGFPLSVDPDYQVWEKDLQERKNGFARALFNNARKATGEEKLCSARTLKRLLKLLNKTEGEKILRELMTTPEAVQELVRNAEAQVESRKSISERTKGKFKRAIDRLLLRDDDFDERI